jgi:hypothetical protein
MSTLRTVGRPFVMMALGLIFSIQALGHESITMEARKNYVANLEPRPKGSFCYGV